MRFFERKSSFMDCVAVCVSLFLFALLSFPLLAFSGGTQKMPSRDGMGQPYKVNSISFLCGTLTIYHFRNGRSFYYMPGSSNAFMADMFDKDKNERITWLDYDRNGIVDETVRGSYEGVGRAILRKYPSPCDILNNVI